MIAEYLYDHRGRCSTYGDLNLFWMIQVRDSFLCTKLTAVSYSLLKQKRHQVRLVVTNLQKQNLFDLISPSSLVNYLIFDDYTKGIGTEQGVLYDCAP